jgi:hypothetical protein
VVSQKTLVTCSRRTSSRCTSADPRARSEKISTSATNTPAIATMPYSCGVTARARTIAIENRITCV